MAKSQRIKTTAGKDMEELELSYIVSRNVKSTTPYLKIWWFLTISIIYLAHKPSILLLCIYPEIRRHLPTKKDLRTFTTLVIKAKTWKYLRSS